MISRLVSRKSARTTYIDLFVAFKQSLLAAIRAIRSKFENWGAMSERDRLFLTVPTKAGKTAPPDAFMIAFRARRGERHGRHIQAENNSALDGARSRLYCLLVAQAKPPPPNDLVFIKSSVPNDHLHYLCSRTNLISFFSTSPPTPAPTPPKQGALRVIFGQNS